MVQKTLKDQIDNFVEGRDIFLRFQRQVVGDELRVGLTPETLEEGREIVRGFGQDKPLFQDVYSGEKEYYQVLSELQGVGSQAELIVKVVDELIPVGRKDVSLDFLRSSFYQKQLGGLSSVATSALLVGLLGTVFAYAIQDTETVSMGIGLVGGGLGACVGALGGNYFLRSRSQRLLEAYLYDIAVPTDYYVKDLRRVFGEIEF